MSFLLFGSASTALTAEKKRGEIIGLDLAARTHAQMARRAIGKRHMEKNAIHSALHVPCRGAGNGDCRPAGAVVNPAGG